MQKLYRWRKNLKEPDPGILFPGITRPDADDDFINCVKYLFNKFFFHFGWEVRRQPFFVIMFFRNFGFRTGRCKTKTADCRLQTAGCRLRTAQSCGPQTAECRPGVKMQTEGKIKTADCGLLAECQSCYDFHH